MEKIIMKECPLHGLTKFVIRKNKKYRCRKCVSMAVNKRRRKVKEELINYKGNECEICGYNKCVGALEFHHMDANDKDFNISSVARSLFVLKKEVDKCLLVCSNCHREIHYEDIKKTIKFNEEQQKENLKNFNLLNKTNYFRKIHLLDIDLIKTDIKNKLKQPEIAKKYGVSLSTLKRFMSKNDICFFRRK